MSEGQGRAAGWAKSSVHIRRTLEDSWFSPSPSEIPILDLGKGRIESAKSLLAHSTVADMRVIGFGI